MTTTVSNTSLTEKTENIVNELKEISEELKCRTIDLTELFESVEEKLSQMNITVTEWADTIIGIREKENFGYKFGFCKVGSIWKLVCRKVQLDKVDNNEKYGLLEYITGMPRAIKIEAAMCMEDLLEKIVRRTKLYIKDVDKATEQMERSESILSKYGSCENYNSDSRSDSNLGCQCRCNEHDEIKYYER